METILLSFHNDAALKDKFVKQMALHAKADELIQGVGWDEKINKGSLIGCSIHEYNVTKLANITGIPEAIIYISEYVFEGLSEKEAKEFARDFYTWVPVGKDLKRYVFVPFIIWILETVKDRRAENYKNYKAIISVIESFKKYKPVEWHDVEWGMWTKWIIAEAILVDITYQAMKDKLKELLISIK